METIEDLGKLTFPALLANSVKKFGDRPALAFALTDDNPITYTEMNENSIKFSKLLSALGLGKSSKIALYGIGCPAWGTAYFGIVNRAMISVPLLPDFSSAEVKAILEHCQVDALVVDSNLYKKLSDITESLPPVIIDLASFSVIKAPGKVPTDEEIAKIELPVIDVPEDEIASIIYTSGTTGRSKGVVLTHKNLVWTAIQGQYTHRINKLDRVLSFLPISHVYEFTIGFLMQILNGACIYYLAKPPVVSALLPAFTKVKPTIILSVPLVMEKIYKNKVLPTFEKSKITKTLYSIPLFRRILNRIAGKSLKKTFGGHLVFFGIGGAKVDPKVERFMKEAKFPYAIGYGLTETSPLLASSGVRITKPGTIGVIVPGVDMKIANPNEEGVGEVVAKAPNVMVGYYKDEALTKAAFTTAEDSCGEGYFKTGDLGIIKKWHGVPRLSLKGRSKNMILSASGENIYPEDIEFILNQHPVVAESLVVEDDNGLVALLQIDEEKLEEEAKKRLSLSDLSLSKIKEGLSDIKENLSDLKEDLSEKADQKKEELSDAMAYQKEVIINEIKFYVNKQVNKSSKIDRIETIKQFEKTASQKIKRYLYDLRSKVTKR
ncbi:MAG: AMP-binding protein [Treponema sp.]|nr:AMP-binding protein [Treponema sp.]